MGKRKPTTYTLREIKNSRFVDRTGHRFGRLTVQHLLGYPDNAPSKYGGLHWQCLCDCGNTVAMSGSVMVSGKGRSCGCYNIDALRVNKRTHGASGTKEYIAYLEAKKRCTYPKHNRYHRYGGRGVEFRFESFEAFFACIGLSPSPKHSLDRIDGDGHYEAGNIRWASSHEQSRNLCTNRKITINGVTKIATDWAVENGLDPRVADYRRRVSGWCDECSVTMPKFSVCVHKNLSKEY